MRRKGKITREDLLQAREEIEREIVVAAKPTPWTHPKQRLVARLKASVAEIDEILAEDVSKHA